VKVELKRRIKALKANELINQSHSLFIGKVFSREAGYEYGEIGNQARYIEKHLEPPSILLSYQYAGAAVRLVLQGCAACCAKGS
jgi:hypothetical protein